MRYSVLPILLFSLSACAVLEAPNQGPGDEALVSAPPPPVVAAPGTVEAFDTTTEAERAEATNVSASGSRLGVTVASLGDPTSPGFWAETPLVDMVQNGRLEYTATGEVVAVELRPIPGDAGAGSRVSLAAFRALGAPLTDLPELVVYAN